MVENREVATEYGPVVIRLYVCDWGNETTPWEHPGNDWIVLSSLNQKVSENPEAFTKHFCSTAHADSWRESVVQ